MAQIGFISEGDTVYTFLEGTSGSTAVGVDSDDGNKYKISTSTTLTTTNNPSTNPNIIIDPAPGGNVTILPNIPAGKLVLNNGNFDIPETTLLTNGIISMDGSPFLHIGVGGTTKVSTYLGINSGVGVTTASNNTGIGQASLVGVTSGSYNTALGTSAGSNLTTESSNILIDHPGVFGDNNTIRIGQFGSGNGQQNKCYIAGIAGINVGSVATVVTENSNQLGTATITAGAGISVTPGANTITIAATSSGSLTWNYVNVAGPIAMVANNGYINDTAFVNTFTLPATAAIGDTFRVTQINAGGSWSISYNAGQTIKMGTATTTVTTGSLDSAATTQGTCVEIICTIADTEFLVISSMGSVTVI